MTTVELLRKEINSLDDLIAAMKDKAEKLRIHLAQISGPAPKGAKKKEVSVLTVEQRAKLIARRQKCRQQKSIII